MRGAGLDPLLIAPATFRYSGLATGILSGDLDDDADRVDIAAWCARQAISFIAATATSIDRSAGCIVLDDGSRHSFDLLSINIGSVIADPIAADAVPVKPLSNLHHLRDRIERSEVFPAISVVGAGRSGFEIAAVLAGLAERRNVRADIIVAGLPRKTGYAWRSLYRTLERRGVRLAKDNAPGDDAVIVAATGLRAPLLIDAAGLAREPGAGVAVNAFLRSDADPRIFAAGDCADFQPRSLPRHGVFGVRQAPVLLHNLIAAARGSRLRRYRPQRRWLSIMDLGDGTGFATWGLFAWRSGAMLRWKRRLDLGFVARFRGP